MSGFQIRNTRIFNRNYIKQNQKSAKDVDYIFSYGANIISSLLEDIDKDQIKNILIYGARGSYPQNALENFTNSIIDYEFYDEKANISKKYDLIISFFDIGTIDDLEIFFLYIYNKLNQNGAFIGTFAGEHSLMEARLKLWQLESKKTSKYSARIWPMIKLNDLTNLLQRSGFANIISFIEKYEHQYSNLYELLKDLKLMGKSGGLLQQEYLPKSLYHEIIASNNLAHLERFDFMNFCAAKNSKIFASKLDI